MEYVYIGIRLHGIRLHGIRLHGIRLHCFFTVKTVKKQCKRIPWQ